MPFEQIFDDQTSSSRKLAQKDYLQAGLFPVIDQGMNKVGGWSNNIDLVFEGTLPAIIFGDHTRIIKYVSSPFVQGADGIKVLVPRSKFVDARFAFWALKTIDLPDKGYSRHMKFLRSSEFPVPPLAEQRRIVARIEALFARTRRARADLERVKLLAKRYRKHLRQSCFDAEALGWPVKKLSSVTENHDGRRVPLKEADRAKRRGRFPYYGASGPIDTIDDFLFDGHYLLVSEDGANLLARSTPIAFQVHGRFWVNNHAHVISPKSPILLPFLEHAIESLDLSSVVTGSAQPKLTQKALNNLPVPLPSLEEQEATGKKIDRANRSSAIAESNASRALALLDHLEKSILTRAFRGELVPQDPNDEPAEAALARARPAPAQAKPRGRRTRQPA